MLKIFSGSRCLCRPWPREKRKKSNFSAKKRGGNKIEGENWPVCVFSAPAAICPHRSRRSLCNPPPPPEGNMEKFCELSFLFDATLRGALKIIRLCICAYCRCFCFYGLPLAARAPGREFTLQWRWRAFKKLSGVEEMTGEKEEFQIAVVGSLNFILMSKKGHLGTFPSSSSCITI